MEKVKNMHACLLYYIKALELDIWLFVFEKPFFPRIGVLGWVCACRFFRLVSYKNPLNNNPMIYIQMSFKHFRSNNLVAVCVVQCTFDRGKNHPQKIQHVDVTTKMNL